MPQILHCNLTPISHTGPCVLSLSLFFTIHTHTQEVCFEGHEYGAVNLANPQAYQVCGMVKKAVCREETGT
jgi:hypothetical protein